MRPRAPLHLSYVHVVRARSGPGLGASSGDLEGSAAPQLRSEAPHRAPLELMYVKTGSPQACPVLAASAPGSLPHRAPHSPWGSGRGGAPGHRSYPAGRVCKNHSLHYLQETQSCLQTTFSSIKGCLEVSRGLSAWRCLSQRKFPAHWPGLAPEAEGTAGRLPTPAQGLEPECLGRGATPRPIRSHTGFGSPIFPSRLTWKHLEGGEGSGLFPARA